MKNEPRIVVFDWMMNKLKLNPTDAILYGCIYGMITSENNELDYFFGSQKYLSKRTNLSEETIRRRINSLCANGLIRKEHYVNSAGKTCCRYYLNEITIKELKNEDSKEPTPETNIDTPHNLMGHTPQSVGDDTPQSDGTHPTICGDTPHNLWDNIKDIDKAEENRIDTESIYQRLQRKYNETCVSLCKSIFVTPLDIDKIDESMANGVTLEQFEEIFRRAEKSKYLRGEVNGFQTTFRYLVDYNNASEILSGKYNRENNQNIKKTGPKRASAGNYDETMRKQVNELFKKEKEKQMKMAGEEYDYLDDVEALGLH